MLTLATDRAAFAAERKPILQRAENALIGSVRYALRHHGEEGWYDALVRKTLTLMRTTYYSESGQRTSNELRVAVREFEQELRRSLNRTKKPRDNLSLVQASRAIAASLSTAAINMGTLVAAQVDEEADTLVKVWLSMHDDRVRHAHAEADGQAVGLNETFEVAGVRMTGPGDMSAPIELWINCRCILGIDRSNAEEEALTAAIEDKEVGPPDKQIEDEDIAVDEAPDIVDETIPWHGVLAPEDTLSGDGRKFTAEALRWRDLPLPLSWQKTSLQGHDGSVVVGRIDEIWRDGNLIKAKGVMLQTAEADEVVGIIAEGGLRGVSVDVDDASMVLQDADGKELEMGDAVDPHGEIMAFTDGRICGATLCAIPAFSEAMVFLGAEEEVVASAFRTISEEPWDGSAGKYTDDEWFRATIIHANGDSRVKSDNKLPILTPSGALSRAGVHAAASRLNQTQAAPELISKAKASLRTAYKELGEDPPENIAASGEEVVEFAPGTEDGPGWLTHPVDTDRLRDYWTKGPGAAKIGWGMPGDFNRCRTHLAEYVKPQHLAGYCANRHKDALGFWPGEHNSIKAEKATAPAVRLSSMTASGTDTRPPAEWFEDPQLVGPSPIVVTEEGRVFGHLAAWGECHIGFGEAACTTAPPSVTDYAYFKTGAVLTDNGEVPVGQITLGTGHAGPRASAVKAAAHYDNTGTAAADVNVGDDEFGVWVAGSVRPGITEEQVYALRAAALSGDWRSIGGNLELVAALAVNVPGFPIPRVQIAASGGKQTALVASGIVAQPEPGTKQEFDVQQIVAAAIDEYERRKDSKARMAALAVKTGRDPKSRMKALAASIERN